MVANELDDFSVVERFGIDADEIDISGDGDIVCLLRDVVGKFQEFVALVRDTQKLIYKKTRLFDCVYHKIKALNLSLENVKRAKTGEFWDYLLAPME